jgi:hypothetical protein
VSTQLLLDRFQSKHTPWSKNRFTRTITTLTLIAFLSFPKGFNYFIFMAQCM